MFDIQSILGSISLISLFVIFLIYIFRKHNPYISIIILFGFSLRLLFGLIQEYYQIVPYMWDENAFHNMSIGFFNFLYGSEDLPYDIKNIGSVPAYGTFLGTLYFFFGQNTFVGRLIGIIMGSVVIFLIYKIASKLELTQKYIYIVCLITAITPSYIIFSGLIMRDTLFWVLTYIFIYLCYNLFENFRFNNIIYIIITIIPLIFLRKQYAPLYALYFLIIMVLILKDKKFYFLTVNINFIKYIFTILIVSLSLVGIYFLMINEVTRWDGSEVVEYFAAQLEYRARGGTSYLDHLEYNSYFDIVKYAPIRFIYFVYGPFIWSANNLFTFVAALENLLIWFFTILFFFRINSYKLINNIKKYNFIIFLLLFILINLAANSIIDSNFGTAIRHKMVYIPIFYTLVFYLITITKRNESL